MTLPTVGIQMTGKLALRRMAEALAAQHQLKVSESALVTAAVLEYEQRNRFRYLSPADAQKGHARRLPPRRTK